MDGLEQANAGSLIITSVTHVAHVLTAELSTCEKLLAVNIVRKKNVEVKQDREINTSQSMLCDRSISALSKARHY